MDVDDGLDKRIWLVIIIIYYYFGLSVIGYPFYLRPKVTIPPPPIPPTSSESEIYISIKKDNR
jgi:hypothetical protein